MKAAVAGARRLAHSHSVLSTLRWGAPLIALTGDEAALDEWSGEFVAVANEIGYPVYVAQGTFYRGWIKVKHHDVADGISLLRRGLNAYRRECGQFTPFYAALLASAYEIAGQSEEALAQFDEALQMVERTGERWFEVELNRLKGQLLLRQGHSEAVEALYRRVLGIAREQEAKLWELRAAVKSPHGCGATRADGPKPATFSHRSTAGSPKASTRRISKRRRRSSRRSRPTTEKGHSGHRHAIAHVSDWGAARARSRRQRRHEGTWRRDHRRDPLRRRRFVGWYPRAKT